MINPIKNGIYHTKDWPRYTVYVDGTIKLALTRWGARRIAKRLTAASRRARFFECPREDV